LVRRRKRDLYGNWVWEDDDEIQTPNDNASSSNISSARGQSSREKKSAEKENDEQLSLDWKDFVAISIASLETFLLPIVVFILILIGILVGLSFFR